MGFFPLPDEIQTHVLLTAFRSSLLRASLLYRGAQYTCDKFHRRAARPKRYAHGNGWGFIRRRVTRRHLTRKFACRTCFRSSGPSPRRRDQSSYSIEISLPVYPRAERVAIGLDRLGQEVQERPRLYRSDRGGLPVTQ